MISFDHAIRFCQIGTACLSLAVLIGCSSTEDATVPQAVAMTEDSIGYYCQMYLLDHGGPKAQILLKGEDEPVWFTQVTHALDYLGDDEQDGEVVAVYVSDMAKASSWSKPGETNWMAAAAGFYVIESAQIGGMGTPEAIPFGTMAEAEAFRAEEGGRIVAFEDVPPGYGTMDPSMASDPAQQTVMEHGHDI